MLFSRLAQMNVTPAYAWVLVGVLIAAFISFFFSFQAGVFALFFLIVAWYVWQYPEEGFWLFIVIAPILPMFKITQTVGTISLVKDVIIITLLLRTFVVPLIEKKLPYRRVIIAAPVILLVVWSVIQTLQADSLILGILRLRDIGLYIALFLGVLYLEHDAERTQQRLKWLLISFGITLFLGAWQWFFAQDSAVLRYDPVREIWIPRLSSILAHPSIFGEYVITLATLLASIFLVVKNTKLRVMSGAFFLVSLPFLFLTYSRAVWLGLVAALGAIAITAIWRIIKFRLAQLDSARVDGVKQKISAAKVGSVALGGVAVCIIALVLLIRFTPAGGLIRSALDPTYASNEERLDFLVRLIAPTTNTQAIRGWGLGDVLEQNFREVDLEAYDIASGAARSVQLTKNRTLVDNQYLKTFVEMGIIGLVLYGWLYIRILIAALRLTTLDDAHSATSQGTKLVTQSPALSGTSARVIGLWQIGFLAAFIVQALFIDIWDIFPTNAAFWILAALTSAASQKT